MPSLKMQFSYIGMEFRLRAWMSNYITQLPLGGDDFFTPLTSVNPCQETGGGGGGGGEIWK